ncbi:hypothetical protein B0H16DRAFT_1452414 [Mycena metata]|uniref:Uncharacterized protein n=1 Tax=Mycena metata TaxID=1033252 RepID=A0AAD7NPW2_9AGAR|nr:hypothetical protein B0H16DRAFT_1452414 [Mycena metata]
MPIPSSIENLHTPPPEFVPCFVNDHLSRNFTNHDDFSQNGNKTYWLMLLPAEDAKSGRDGVYSLKWVLELNCQGSPYHYDEHRVVGSVSKWEDVLPVWRKHCFGNHPRCPQHPDACKRGTCPQHPREEGGQWDSPRRGPHPEDVKPRVKREAERDEDLGGRRPRRVKREASPVVSHRSQRSGSDSSEDSDIISPGGAPLFERDTPPTERRSRRRASATVAPSHALTPSRAPTLAPSRAPTVSHATTPSRAPSSHVPTPSLPRTLAPSNAPTRSGAPSHAPTPSRPPTLAPSRAPTASRAPIQTPPPLAQAKSPAPHVQAPATHTTLWASSVSKMRGVSAPAPSATSSTVSSTSSLSSSTALSAASSAATEDKGKGRAIPLGGGAGASGSGSASAAEQEMSLSDTFFVSANGKIHRSAEDAFEDLSMGPVKAVKGWMAATDYARDMVA